MQEPSAVQRWIMQAQLQCGNYEVDAIAIDVR